MLGSSGKTVEREKEREDSFIDPRGEFSDKHTLITPHTHTHICKHNE